MCNKANLKSRVEKAKAATHFIKVLSTDDLGRVKTALVPGSNGKRYQVILRRNGKVSVECRLDCGNGYKPCRGNRVDGAICYHAMAVLTLAAQESGKSISWVHDKGSAERLSRTGGDMVKFSSYQHVGGYQWGVVK